MLTPTKLTSVTCPSGEHVVRRRRGPAPGRSAAPSPGGRRPTRRRPSTRARSLPAAIRAPWTSSRRTAPSAPSTLPETRLDWPRKLATNVVAGASYSSSGAPICSITALVHHRDRVGHGHGLLLVVGDVDEGDPDLGLDPLELDLHLAAQLEVERAERLVEEQHLRLVDQRPGQRDALLLAAGELGRAALARARPARRAPASRSTWSSTSLLPCATQAEGDVVGDRQVREQRVALEHRVDRAPVGLEPGDVVVAERDGARGGLLEPGHHPQGRGLAAAGRAEQREERALRDGQVQVVDRGEGTERLGDRRRASGPQPSATRPRSLSRSPCRTAVGSSRRAP